MNPPRPSGPDDWISHEPVNVGASLEIDTVKRLQCLGLQPEVCVCGQCHKQRHSLCRCWTDTAQRQYGTPSREVGWVPSRDLNQSRHSALAVPPNHHEPVRTHPIRLDLALARHPWFTGTHQLEQAWNPIGPNLEDRKKSVETPRRLAAVIITQPARQRPALVRRLRLTRLRLARSRLGRSCVASDHANQDNERNSDCSPYPLHTGRMTLSWNKIKQSPPQRLSAFSANSALKIPVPSDLNRPIQLAPLDVQLGAAC